MREIIALIVVQCQAKLTFVRSEMILHKVRILLEINGLESGCLRRSASVDLGLRVRRDPPEPAFAPQSRSILTFAGKGDAGVYDWQRSAAGRVVPQRKKAQRGDSHVVAVTPLVSGRRLHT